MNDEIDLRKASQEVEIDHLLAEEFYCDPNFLVRFAEACRIRFSNIRVIDVVPEPSLGGNGYGDLLVKAEMDGQTVAFLIEDKITASAATRQAERYAEHAEKLRRTGFDSVFTVLLAPRSYNGERDRYGASVDLEDVAEMVRSADEVRRNYRRGIISRALKKKVSSGVKCPDPAMRELHRAYLIWFSAKCLKQNFRLSFPPLKESYYDGDSWVNKISCDGFPLGVWLRHRLWVSANNTFGSVDLIMSLMADQERDHLEHCKPNWATMTLFGKPEKRNATFGCSRSYAAIDWLLREICNRFL